MPKGKSALSPGDKAKLKPTSMKFAIAAFCYHDCFGEEKKNSHATKMLIRDCKNTSCQLWLHRGWQDVTGGNVMQGDPETKLPQKHPQSKARIIR